MVGIPPVDDTFRILTRVEYVGTSDDDLAVAGGQAEDWEDTEIRVPIQKSSFR